MGRQITCPDCGHVNLPGEEDCSVCHAPISALATPQPKAGAQHGMQRKILAGTVRDLKPRDAAAAAPDATVAEAVKLMREKRVGCVLVARRDVLAGIFTERDLLLSSDPSKDIATVKLSEVMRPDPEFLREDQPLAFAFHKMTIHGHHHVPVRRADGSWAMISARDLLRYLCS